MSGDTGREGRSMHRPCEWRSEQRLDGGDDGVGVDPGGMEQFGGLAGAGHLVDGQLHDRRRLLADAREGIQHRVAQAALEPVVFDHDQLAAGVLRRPVQRLLVDRLDRVERRSRGS